MFQSRFGKVDEFVWWDMEIFQTDAGTQFTYNEFQECLSAIELQLSLEAPDLQEINVQVELIWRKL